MKPWITILLTLCALAWNRPAFGGEIHDAARDGDLARVKALLKVHPDLISSQDTFGMTPLHYAAHAGNKDMVAFLLASQADVNTRDKYGQTPLHTAARLGYPDVVELLLAAKAGVNAKNDIGWTALHEAAAGGHQQVAGLLLASQAEVDARDHRNETPLLLAAMFDPRLIAKARSGGNAGTQAVAAPAAVGPDDGYKQVVELLLAHHASVNARDTNGTTPLHAAALAGHQEVAELLLAHQADVDARDNQGMTPLHGAIWAIAHAHQSVQGEPPLPESEIRKFSDVAELLRQHGGH